MIRRILLFQLIISSVIFSQPAESLSSSEIKIALQRLNTLGTVLYIAAHPDDENTAFLAYYNYAEHLRTGYLALTRGDGGQNLIGDEQGDLLSIIRTQELLQARNIDGAEQFFSRAVDFGYSKTPEETLEKWGKENILSDVVWVIRKFKPDVIVTRFPPSGLGRHGHHTASALLAIEAFNLSNDPNAFPEQLKYVQPWQAKRIFWNAWTPALNSMGINPDTLIKIKFGRLQQAFRKILHRNFCRKQINAQKPGFWCFGNKRKFIQLFSSVRRQTSKGKFI